MLQKNLRFCEYFGLDTFVWNECWRSSSNHTYDFTGLVGSGILDVFTEGNIGQQNIEIMNSFITPITISIGILSVGVISGGITYINIYFYGNKM